MRCVCGGERPGEDHHGGLRQRAVLPPVGAVERERRVRAERSGERERGQREHHQPHELGAPQRHQRHAGRQQQHHQFRCNVEVEEQPGR